MDPLFANLLTRFQASSRYAPSAIRDPEPGDFEPQDGPDYDDPDDLLS